MDALDAQPSEEAVVFHAADTLTKKQVSDLIQKMRARKHQDSVLGVHACNPYDRVDDIDKIRRTPIALPGSVRPFPLTFHCLPASRLVAAMVG